MPTLELGNLAPYRYPPPITSQSQNQPVGPSAPGSSTSCSCQPGLQLCVEQGATLSSQLALTITDANGNKGPLDITGFNFEFTAKTSLSLPDTDPTVVEVDWTETSTPTQGTTWLIIPATTTDDMLAVPYYYQVRMIQSPTSPTPIVTPLFSGTITVIQPVSTRH
jgi:hypothetical protein